MAIQLEPLESDMEEQMVKRGRSKLTILTCKRCRHNWVPRISHPTVCPFCHSPYWDKPTSAKKVSKRKKR